MHTVNGRRATTQLINQHQRGRRDMINQVRCFFHLHHESAHIILHVIISAQSRENAITNTDRSKATGDVATNLRQDSDQGNLFDIDCLLNKQTSK